MRKLAVEITSLFEIVLRTDYESLHLMNMMVEKGQEGYKIVKSPERNVRVRVERSPERT